jgi:hypothetical protein
MPAATGVFFIFGGAFGGLRAERLLRSLADHEKRWSAPRPMALTPMIHL